MKLLKEKNKRQYFNIAAKAQARANCLCFVNPQNSALADLLQIMYEFVNPFSFPCIERGAMRNDWVLKRIQKFNAKHYKYMREKTAAKLLTYSQIQYLHSIEINILNNVFSHFNEYMFIGLVRICRNYINNLFAANPKAQQIAITELNEFTETYIYTEL